MGKAIDLTGQKFGKLTVIKSTKQRRKNGGIVWECECDCGNITFVDVNSLRGKNTTSCGCIKDLDLTGQKFGRLTVVIRDFKREELRKKKNLSQMKYWLCNCECGTKNKSISSGSLLSSNQKSCGCLKIEKAKEQAIDITGQKFGRLTAIEPTSKRKQRCVVWKCKCDCGNNVLVSTGYLLNKQVQSCGCLRKETGFKNGRQLAQINIDENVILGTNILLIAKEEPNKNNKTGYKGVCLEKSSGRYVAQIQFRNKNYKLGRFGTAEEASEVYQIAKEKIHGEFLKWYEEELKK